MIGCNPISRKEFYRAFIIIVTLILLYYLKKE